MIIDSKDCAVTLNGVALPGLQSVEITQAAERPRYAAGHGRIELRGMARLFLMREAALRRWREALSLYGTPNPHPKTKKAPRPKWGQRGRHRLRKTRQIARAVMKAVARVLKEIKRADQSKGTAAPEGNT